ncbi:MAG: AbrB family transcriptional regulator [Treponema sp.]|jgi:membrane AbrB-like protein|nr:AbrB family transcriptional regulator [Treponema sp.]
MERSTLIFNLFLTLASGIAFGLLAAKLKVPGGLMIGAIIGAALLNILSGAGYMPRFAKTTVQIIAGAFIGCSLERGDIKRLPKILKPMLIMLGGFFTLTVLAGFVIHTVSPLDWATAFMSAVPGGISDTPIIAADMGADTPKVAVMQTARLIFGLGVFPSLILTYDTRRLKRNAPPEVPKPAGEKRAASGVLPKRKPFAQSWLSCAATLAAGSIAGIFGRLTPIPAGAFVFSIIAVLILKLLFDFAWIPRRIKQCAQVLSGCYVGAGIFLQDVLEMRYLALPLAVIIAGYMANCFLTGKIIQKFCGFTRRESMLITIPAGASDMALIASDLGVENPDIMILQVTRLLAVMTLFPQAIHLILIIVS